MSNQIDIDLRTQQYIALRDKIKGLEDEHKAKMAPFKEMLENLNNLLLDELNKANMESVRTASGTVYRTEKKSASLADPDGFMRYVIAHQSWDLLDRRANVTAVADFITEHGSPPPGCNFVSTYVVGVRRPTK